jgi:hypothetical protein
VRKAAPAMPTRFLAGETVYLDLRTFAIIHKPLPRKTGKVQGGWVAVAIDRETGVITYKRAKRPVRHARS